MMIRPTELARSATHWLVHEEGCSRALGLIRIGTGLMIWARFADRFQFHPGLELQDALIALAYYSFTLLMIVGQWSRLSTAATAFVMLYGYHYRGVYLGTGGWTNHNMQLLDLTTAILALTPSGQSYSFDRWRALKAARAKGLQSPPEIIPQWSVRLLALLLVSVYVSTVAQKTNLAYLSGERLQATFASHYTGSDYLEGTWEWFVQICAIGVWLVELLLIFGLFIAPWRRWLMLAGAWMHLTFYACFRIYTFSTNMVLLYLPFVPPRAVRRGIDRMCGYHLPDTWLDECPGTSRWQLVLRSTIVSTVVLGALAVGLNQLSMQRARAEARLEIGNRAEARTNPELRERLAQTSDLRVPGLMLLQPRMETTTHRSARRRSPNRWQRRDSQIWNP